MGACFDSVTFDACDTKVLTEKFREHQDAMCDDNGRDAYAGHIGIARGLTVSTKVFKTSEEAENYLVENAQKWGPAIAVKVGDFSKIFPVTATEKKEVKKLEELKEKFENWDKNLIVRAKSAKSAQRGCKKCGSKVAVKYISTNHCPVCGDMHFIETDTDKKARQTLQKNYQEQTKKVKEMSQKYKEKNKDNFWLVGAWCAS